MKRILVVMVMAMALIIQLSTVVVSAADVSDNRNDEIADNGLLSTECWTDGNGQTRCDPCGPSGWCEGPEQCRVEKDCSVWGEFACGLACEVVCHILPGGEACSDVCTIKICEGWLCTEYEYCWRERVCCS